MAHEELAQALRRLARGRRRDPVCVEPGCPFGAVVRQRVTDLERQVDDIQGRLYGLLFVVAGAVVVDIVLRLVR